MLSDEALVRESLTSCVRCHLPEADGQISLTRITTGKFNTSFFVQTGDRELVLRIAPPRDSVFLFYERDMMRQEPEIHGLLLERTSVPVAEIIAFDDSQQMVPRDFLLMERLPGRAMSECSGLDPERVLRQVGHCLAQAHAITADQYGYLGRHKPMEPQAAWPDAFWIMWRKLLDDIVGVGHYSDEECSLLLRLLDRHRSIFDRKVSASLLHMDVWAQNILVGEDGNLSGLVDWDRALWGDPEIEFAVLDYCGVSEPAFWEGYGRARDDSREAQLRNIFYLLYELQKYIVIRQGRGNNSASARGYKQQAMQIVERYLGV